MSNGRCKCCACVKAGHSCVDYWPLRNVPKKWLNVIPSDNSDKPISSVSGGNFLQCSAITPKMCDDSHDTSESFAIFSPGQTDISIYPHFRICLKNQTIYMWGEMDNITFTNNLNSAYDEIMKWRRNIFRIPYWHAGKSFVSAYADRSLLESIAFKSAMPLPTLILQKPFRTSKTKDHINCIEKRLDLWLKSDIDALIMKGHTLQRSFKPSDNARSDKRSAASLAKLIIGGQVKATL